MAEKKLDRKQLIELLNEDLSREYQAIIAYVVYSQVLKGAEYMNIAGELEVHAGEELQHAITLAKQIDYLGGMPGTTALQLGHVIVSLTRTAFLASRTASFCPLRPGQAAPQRERSLARSRSSSRYSHTSVIMRANAPNHSMYRGAL